MSDDDFCPEPDESSDYYIEGPESLLHESRMPPDSLTILRKGVGMHARSQALRVAAELARRELEPLNLYQPTPKQDEFHACDAKECLFQAGNQIGKLAPVSEPVLTPSGFVRIGDLRVGDTVVDGMGEPTKVIGVFPQGQKEIYRVTFDDGSYTYCGIEHLWKCKITKRERFGDGDWGVRTLREIIDHGGMEPSPVKRAVIPTAVAKMDSQAVPIDPYTFGCLIGDGSFVTTMSFTNPDGEIKDSLVLPSGNMMWTCKSGRKGLDYCIGRQPGERYNHLRQIIKDLGLSGCRSWEKFLPDCYKYNSVGVRLAVLRGLMDTDGNCTTGGIAEFCTTSPELADDIVFLVRSLGGKCKVKWRTTHYTTESGRKKFGRASARVRVRMWYANPFQMTRKADRWKRPVSTSDGRLIYKIETAGVDDCVCIAVDSPDHTYITRDFIVTHNSLAGFIEDARAVLNLDPYKKYPAENGRLAIVGYKESHIALNVHRYLLQPGAFDIIRDEETGHWRTFHPWVPSDAARKKDAIPAPPMLPERYIESIHWKSKSGCIFKRIDLTTGWQVHAFSSTAKPDQGFQLDLAHIDEDIINEQWYSELMARLSMREGRLRWTALPHNENDALNRVAERGEAEMAEHRRGGEKPTTVIVRATIFDNPYMTERTRQENIKRWKAIGEDEYRKRALGDLVTDTVRMYPMFNENIHAVQIYGESHGHLFGEYLKTRIIPDDWCLRVFVDPGYDTMGCLVMATLPDDVCHIAVRELYIRQCTPTTFAMYLEKLIVGRSIQCHYMDAHGGSLTSLADGRRPQEVYEHEMLLRKLFSVETRHRFRAACDSISYRETQLRERLAVLPGGSGLPSFLYDKEFCPNLEMEMIRFRKQKIKGEVIDKGNRRSRTHLVDCYEYASAEPLDYIKPPQRRRTETRSERRTRMFHERKDAKRRKSAALHGNLQGGIILGS